jgi:hypothetical protein
MFKIILYSILAFFLIFAFPVIPLVSSAKLVMLYVIVITLLSKNSGRQLWDFSCRLSGFTGIYFLVFFYTVAVAVVLGTFEMTLTNKVFSCFILYIISFLFFDRARIHINIEKAVVYCFAVQSICIILAIFSESFYSLTEPFRSVDIENETTYGRLRGNAICGYQFFGIASMYTFVIIYLILHLKEFKYGLLLLLLICFVAICSGRFSFVGIIIGGSILLFKYIVNRQLGKIIWICLVCVILFVTSVVLLYNYVDNISDPVMYKVVHRYLIQPIDSVLFERSFQSSSTDSLFEMYESEEIKQYFLLGSGRYVTADGHYFGKVDVGYYRMLGYYGILGFLIISYAFYYLIYRTKSGLDIYTKHAFFINFLVLNFKGDVQVFNNNIIPIVVAFMFFNSSQQENCQFVDSNK